MSMLSVIYAECRYAECRYAECCYAECLFAECRYAECRGSPLVSIWSNRVLYKVFAVVKSYRTSG